MLILDTTTSLLRLTTSAAGDIDVHVSGTEHDWTTPGPATETFRSFVENTQGILTATTTTVCVSPTSATKDKNIKLVYVRNDHGSVTNTITVVHTNGTTVVNIPSFTLAPGEWALINGEGVVFCYDTGGGVKTGTGPGRWRRTTVLTSGTSFTTLPGVASIYVRLQGAGGGGGGCTSVASAAAAGGGGGGGGYAEKTFAVSPSTAYAYAIGAAGTGVSGAGGNAGGNTTFTVGGVTVTAFGGGGAPVATAATTLTARAGGAGAVISTNGDVNSGGAPGNYGVTLIVATPIVASGAGGNAGFGGGGGGLGLVAVGNGNNAVGFGAGGGGSATGASAVRTGGNGGAGVIIVDEYS